MTTHRALNLFLAFVVAAVLATGCLLDGPSELEAARAVAADTKDAIESVAISARIERAIGQSDHQTIVAAVQP